MARYFAQINEENIVQRVLVADSLEWCVQNLGGDWIETFEEGANFASKGHTYHHDKNNFSAPKPYKSWILDEKLEWKSPVKHPEDGAYDWDEKKGSWKKVSKGVNKI